MLGIIESLIRTLGCIEVHGRANLDMLLGCIQTLEQMREALTKEGQDADRDEQGA